MSLKILYAFGFGVFLLTVSACSKPEQLLEETHIIDWQKSATYTQTNMRILFRYADEHRCPCQIDCASAGDCIGTLIVTRSNGQDTTFVLSSLTNGVKPNVADIDGAKVMLERIGPNDLCKEYQQYEKYKMKVKVTR